LHAGGYLLVDSYTVSSQTATVANAFNGDRPRFAGHQMELLEHL